jgi:hypothetical protein
VAVRKHCGIADPDYEVEFHGAIASMIPSLIRRLEDKGKYVRRETVKLIGKLANHGEWQLESIAASLIQTAKSSFVEPSRAWFRPLLDGLRTRTTTFDGRQLS